METGMGILQPWISHQFAITFDALPNSILAKQVVKANFDLKNKKVKIDFEIPVAFEQFSKDIRKLIERKLSNITVSSPGVTFTPIFGLCNCKLENAWFDLDYMICSSTVKLHTEFVFEGLIPSSGIEVVKVH
jgi:hypothetical protein